MIAGVYVEVIEQLEKLEELRQHQVRIEFNMKCCSDSSQFSAKSVILPERRPAEYNCDFHIILAEPMEGLHLTADCFDCQCPIELLLSPAPLQKLLTEFTLKAGLTMVGERFFPFTHEDGSAAGITGTLLLAESHFAIHTARTSRDNT